jgi:DNA polymerase-4
VKYADYQQVTRSRTLPEPISGHDEMLNLALELLADTEVENRHARLLGLTISNLDGAEGEDDGSEYVQLTIDFG